MSSPSPVNNSQSSGNSPNSTANSTPNTNSNAKSTIQVKLVLLGEAAVGKSSVALRFVNKEFQENKEPTIGAAFLTQKSPVGDKTIKYEIWDTAGQERFHSLAPMYYRNAQAAVVVYDITKKATLDKAIAWIKELQRQANGNIVIALCGNKLDLADETQELEVETEEGQDENEVTTARQVATQVGEETAREFGLLFFETSAKSGQGINDMFTEIAKKLPLDSIISSRNPYRPNQLNSGNGRIDLLRESGGADSLNATRGDRANGNNAGFNRGGCC